MKEEIDLIDMIKYFWNKKVWFILVAIICVVLAAVYTKYLVTPQYTATSAFILTNDNMKTEAEVYLYDRLPDRYYAIINSTAVLDKVVDNLKLDDIDDIAEFKEKNIEITYTSSCFLLRVTVTTDSAKEAADIANEMVKVAIEEIKNTYKDEKIQILDYAQENWEPVNIDLRSNIVKFVLVGEILVCGYILAFYMIVEEMKKDKLKELEEKERVSKEYEIKEKEILATINKKQKYINYIKERKELEKSFKKDEYENISKINDEILKYYAKEMYIVGYMTAMKSERKVED